MRARSGITNSDVISPDNDLIDLQAAVSRMWEPRARSVGGSGSRANDAGAHG